MQFKLPMLIALSLALTAPLTLGDGASGAKWGYKQQTSEVPANTKSPAHQDNSVTTSVSSPLVVLDPANWGHSYPTCDGKSQSPIDISVGSRCGVKQPVPLSFSGDCSSYGLKAFEDTFKWVATNTTCKVHKGDQAYALLQFHLHMPSEHTLNKKSFDAEAHFVHQEVGGNKLLVIGMFLSQKQSSGGDAATAAGNPQIQTQSKQKLEQQHPWIDTVWNSVAAVNSTVQVTHSYADLLAEKMDEGSVFNYAGSLTTPPCSEGVDWWVIKSPLAASAGSLQNFKQQLATLEATDEGKGARPVQPLNGREITVY